MKLGYLIGLVLGVVLGLCVGAAASRNSSGTMSAANGPYVGGTVINVSQVNSRFADIESEITDSLSRSGKGSMTAALKVADGTVALPGVSFSSETASGLYRIGSNNAGLAINGSKRQDWTTTGSTITGTAAVTSTLAVTGTTTSDNITTSHTGGTASNTINASTVSNQAVTIYQDNTSTKWLAGKDTNNDYFIYDNNASRYIFSAATGQVPVLSQGVKIGGGGTSITQRLSQSFTIDFASVAAGSVGTSSQTLTGAATGDQCRVSVRGNLNCAMVDCYVSAANTVIIREINFTTGACDLSSGSFDVELVR